jgi:nucleoside-diphosphate-sugar epimerase
VESIDRADAAGPYLVMDDPIVEVREFIWGIADGLSLPRPARSVPRFIDSARTWLPRPLRWDVRRYGIGTFTRELQFSTERVRRDLGYCSHISYAEGMRRLVAWARAEYVPKSN